MRRDIFLAIADPTRRAIFGLLAIKALNVQAVAERFEISRPAVSKHIKILEECGAVEIQQQGRERICVAKVQSLKVVSDWVDQYQKFWTEKLDSLENFLLSNDDIE